MNIVHVITGLDDGGAEAVLYRLCVGDGAHVHRVISLTGEGKYGLELRERGIPVLSLNLRHRAARVTEMLKLFKALKEGEPDVIQTWMYHGDLFGGVIGRLGRTRAVVWGIRNSALHRGKSRRTTIAVATICARLSRWIPRKIVVCAESAARIHAELGYDASKMVVIPNGYDLETFGLLPEVRQELRDAWGVPDEVPLIGLVGRFDPLKDHANLVSAMGILRERGRAFHCVMIGTGVNSDNEVLCQQIVAEGLDGLVEMLGPRSDIPAVMNALDLHVLPSIAEGFPNVLAEAMACGTPCVTTDVGDAAAIVGETGWVVPAADPKALASAMEDALDEWTDRGAWWERQTAARRQIEENFSIDRMIAAYHEVWREAGGSGARS